MDNIPLDSPVIPETVPGWGIDACDHDPAFPMRKLSGAEHDGYTWDRPYQQTTGVEVLKSNERPGLSSVFGTTCPPAGVSGLLRRWAFRFSESSYGHWLPLMLADRLEMLGGIGSDLGKGRVPNLFAEKGLKADWRYDRGNLLVKCTGCLVAGAVILLLTKRR